MRRFSAVSHPEVRVRKMSGLTIGGHFVQFSDLHHDPVQIFAEPPELAWGNRFSSWQM